MAIDGKPLVHPQRLPDARRLRARTASTSTRRSSWPDSASPRRSCSTTTTAASTCTARSCCMHQRRAEDVSERSARVLLLGRGEAAATPRRTARSASSASHAITDEARNPFEKRARQSGIAPMTLSRCERQSGRRRVRVAARSASLSRAAAAKLFAGAPVTLDACSPMRRTASRIRFRSTATRVDRTR